MAESTHEHPILKLVAAIRAPFQKRRFAAIGLAFVAAIVLSIWIGTLIERSGRSHMFRARAIRDLGLVQQQLRAIESGVYALEGLYRASEHVTEGEFRAFASSVLMREPGLQALFHVRPELHDVEPMVAYGAGFEPLAIDLHKLVIDLNHPHVTFESDLHESPPDLGVLLIPLGADQGVIGGFFTLQQVLLAANRPLVDTWSSIEVFGGPDQLIPLAHLNLETAPATLSEQIDLPFADANLRLVAKPTRRFWMDSKTHLPKGMGLVVGLIGALVLVRYRAHHQRRQADDQLLALQSALPLPWSRFGPKLELVQWNRPFAMLLEFEPEEESRWYLGIDSQNLDRLHATMRQALESGAVHQIEISRYNKAGEKISLLAIAQAGSSSLDEHGLQIVWLDSTEARRLEEKVWRAQKLDAVGQLAGGIAHDFNNALTAISGYSNIVLSSLEPGTSLFEDVERILAASHRAAGLTTRLLSITRSHEGQRSPTRLNEVLDQTINLARSSLGSAIRLEVELADSIPSVYADPVQIEHLLLNLLFNARDAMPEGGTIAVSTEFKQIDAPASGAVLQPRPGPYVVFVVGDTGQGIPPENMSMVFEPLYTTKQFGHGTGLGLSMVRSVVASHEGGLWCYSEVGVGTTIRIALPASETPKPSANVQPIGGNERILVIDDQVSICELTRRYLSSLGYKVEIATNNEEALTHVREKTFDLFLIDVLLQGSTGIELAQELLAIQPDVPILFMSGYSATLLQQRTTSSAPLKVLSKPFSLSALAKATCELLHPPSTIGQGSEID